MRPRTKQVEMIVTVTAPRNVTDREVLRQVGEAVKKVFPMAEDPLCTMSIRTPKKEEAQRVDAETGSQSRLKA